MNSTHPVLVIAITSGKGGAGKTNVSVNLSLALAELGQRVVLLDADLGLANVDLSLGLTPKHTLIDVIEGRLELRDVMLKGPGGIRIVPATSGDSGMSNLTTAQYAGLIQAFNDIDDDLDVLVIDTAAGVSEQVVHFVRAAHEVLVVICDEPSSIANAYAFIRMLNRDYGMNRFHVLANRVKNPQDGRSLFNKLTKLTDNYLDAALHYAGHIPYDKNVAESLKRQRALYETFPRSKASQAFRTLAQKVNRWPLQTTPRGHLEFFVERLLRRRAKISPA
jgi:flagellar biosynthesis protein FlhG